jgi:16S rRNA (guanine966-N2)-methyltransferase
MPSPRKPTKSGRNPQANGPGLRIIAGTMKGRRIAAPPADETRPLTDRIKQSLFDWLGNIEGFRIADVCAGSGSFSFEAASRGATEVHAIEMGRQPFAVLTANFQHLLAPPAVRLHQGDAFRVLPTLHDLDLVFADPPFPWFREHPEMLTALLTAAAQALAPEGSLVIRGETGYRLSPVPGLTVIEERQYGRSWIALLRLV